MGKGKKKKMKREEKIDKKRDIGVNSRRKGKQIQKDLEWKRWKK